MQTNQPINLQGKKEDKVVSQVSNHPDVIYKTARSGGNEKITSAMQQFKPKRWVEKKGPYRRFFCSRTTSTLKFNFDYKLMKSNARRSRVSLLLKVMLWSDCSLWLTVPLGSALGLPPYFITKSALSPRAGMKQVSASAGFDGLVDNRSDKVRTALAEQIRSCWAFLAIKLHIKYKVYGRCTCRNLASTSVTWLMSENYNN